MKRLLLPFAVALVLAPSALASPTVRLTLIHVMQGCHVWGDADGQALGPTRTLKVKPGTRLSVRITCPMDFDVRGARWLSGTVHTLRFKKRGIYRFTFTNVQTPEERGLETLGPVNTPTLTVRVG